MGILSYLTNLVNGFKYGSTYDTQTKSWSSNTPPPSPVAQYHPGPPQQAPQQQYSPAAPQAAAPVLPQQASPVAVAATARNPEVSKFKIMPEVSNAITSAANKYKVPASLLYDIALQESSFDPRKVNPNAPPGLNPLGLFQFTDRTWNDILNRFNNKPGMTLRLPSTDRFDPQTNAEAAAYLISHGQLGKWNASQDVWGPHYTQQEVAPFYAQSQDAFGLTKGWKQ